MSEEHVTHILSGSADEVAQQIRDLGTEDVRFPREASTDYRHGFLDAIDHGRTKRDALQAENARLERNHEQNLRDMADMRDRHDQDGAENEQIRNEMSAVGTLVHELMAENERLSGELERLTTENERLAWDLATCHESRGQIDLLLAELQAELARVKAAAREIVRIFDARHPDDTWGALLEPIDDLRQAVSSGGGK